MKTLSKYNEFTAAYLLSYPSPIIFMHLKINTHYYTKGHLEAIAVMDPE